MFVLGLVTRRIGLNQVCCLSVWAALAVASTPNALAQSILAPRQGMAVTTAIAEPQGDYESHKIFMRREGDAWLVAYSASALARDGQPKPVSATRLVRDADVASAVEYRSLFEADTDEDYPGTTALGASARVLQLLKQEGRAGFAMVGERHAFNQLAAGLNLPMVGTQKARYAGELQRVGNRRLTVSVNGVATALPAVEARGRLLHKGDAIDVTFAFLDDDTNPIALEWRAGKTTLRVVRVNWPQAAPALADALKTQKRVVLPGVYFDFGEAKLKRESATAIAAATAAINALPSTTQLRVEGHTDNIGQAGVNQQLAQARADAVRAALIMASPGLGGRTSAQGFGASRPIADNTTLEGRAQNRRVELVIP